MSHRKKIACCLVCAALDALCLTAGGIPDLKGFALLVLTDYCIYRLFTLLKRPKGKAAA